jgi:hypothetical protein
MNDDYLCTSFLEGCNYCFVFHFAQFNMLTTHRQQRSTQAVVECDCSLYLHNKPQTASGSAGTGGVLFLFLLPFRFGRCRHDFHDAAWIDATSKNFHLADVPFFVAIRNWGRALG